MTLNEVMIGHIASNVLKAEKIKVIRKLSGGLTNISYLVLVDDQLYVFRLAGKDTDKIINRDHEKKALELAKDLKIDETFVAMNPIHGWKISKYLDNCYYPDYTKKEDQMLVINAMQNLHNKKAHVNWEFRPYEDACKIENMLHDIDYELREKVQNIYYLIKNDKAEKCFCHCDTYNRNFLINKDTKQVTLIDWEYAGESDPAVDVAYYIVDAMYEYDEALKFIKEYLETDDERLVKHYLAYIPIVAYYWYVWALFREECGSMIGEAKTNWYNIAHKYSDFFLEKYYEK